jgi:hypothetical protein
VSDRRSLSRRKLLWAVATAGVAASTGSGAAAVLSDAEEVNGLLTAGMLDLDPDPSWGNDGSTGSISGAEGRETITIDVSGNPSYVWFRTRCKQCTPAEEEIRVRLGLDVDGDDTVDRWLLGAFENGGYLSLRETRERLGSGTLLGDGQLVLTPADTWTLVVEWETTDDTVTTDLDADFDFDLYATQTRHVANTDTVAPPWTCPGVTCGPTGGGDPPSGVTEISFVALCSADALSPSDVTLEFSEDGTAVTVRDVSADVTVETVVLKYSTKLDVFQYGGDPSSYATGDAPTTLDQQTGPGSGGRGSGYEGSDRTNPTPCLTANGIKYDVGSGWQSEGGDE